VTSPLRTFRTSSRLVILLLGAVLLAAVLAPLRTDAAPPTKVPLTALPGELVVNGGAQSGDTSGWTGSLQVHGFGSGGYPDAVTLPLPGTAIPDAGTQFFSGSGASSEAYQDIDLTPGALAIDDGVVVADLSAYLGGYSDQADRSVVRYDFYDASDNIVQTVELPTVTREERNDESGFIHRTDSLTLDAGVRRARVTFQAFRSIAPANDGYVENISLQLFAPGPEAVDDSATTSAGNPVTVNVATNDEAPPAATIDAPSVRLIDGGTLVDSLTTADGLWEVNTTTGAITFTPDDPAFTGPAGPVPYSVADSRGQRAEATLTVQVTDGDGSGLFLGCSDLTTFDNGADGWRFATVTQGVTVNGSYPVAAGWDANEGNPGGALHATDPDSTWSEIWTPAFSDPADFTDLIGEVVQFDYRNDTGIGYNLYLAVWSDDGDKIWFNFRPQITNSQAWNRVRVPMDASQWHTGFSNATGVDLGSPAPSDSQFADVMANVDHFAISVEGRNGSDTTYIDNFGQPCDDLGDAPASYGTTYVGDNGPSHRVVGYDATAHTADLMLGDTVDIEDDGVPSTNAVSDDSTGIDDEDGVSSPIVVTDGVATDVTVSATNDTTQAATLAGWIDLDGDGVFEASELVTTAVPAGSGTDDYVLSFPSVATAVDGYARFRLFTGNVTDPLPTGPAIGGEVEDYVVTTVVPDPSLSIVKEANLNDINGNGVADVGETIDYRFTVKNTGNVTITGISVDDDRVTGLTPSNFSLDPDEDIVVTADPYVVTDDDLYAGGVQNQATAGGVPPGGGTVTSPPDQITTRTPDPDPSLRIVKSAELNDDNGNGRADVGETIDYTFRVENNGNVTISGISVIDDRVTGLTPSGFTLAPHLAQYVTADPYVVTAADVRAGRILNVATAEGFDPRQNPVRGNTSRVTIDIVDPDDSVLPDAGASLGPWSLLIAMALVAGGYVVAGGPSMRRRPRGRHLA